MNPQHADALHLLGVIALQTGHPAEAIALISRAIAQSPGVASFHNNLGNAFRAAGELQQAAVTFRQALTINANAPETLYNLGVAVQDLGELVEAAELYERVLRGRPDHAGAHCNLGNVRHAQGRFEEALAGYEKALAHQPDFLPALTNRGNILKKLGRLSEAERSYRRALLLNPQAAEAHNNLGLTLLEVGRVDEAIESYKDAVRIQPGYLEAHRNLGHALRERGNSAESQKSFRRAASLDANDPEAQLGLALSSIPVFVDDPAQSAGVATRFQHALAEMSAWNARLPGRLGRAIGSAQPFYLAYRPYDLTAALASYGDLICPAAARVWMPSPRVRAVGEAARQRTRMVVVSGHVRGQHPVWEMLLRGILEHLKRDQFEVFLYHTGPVVDAETSWARSQVDRFVQGPKPVNGWVAEIQADQPDVVFYPEIGMDPVTCTLAALRLAPLQAASWGHPVTSGLPTIDLYLSGALLESPHAEAHYREELVRLPGTGACTRSPSEALLVWDHDPGREKVLRFAMPHQPIKFDPGDDHLLTRIARQVGRCEFWLASPAKLGWATDSLLARLASVFRAAGLDPAEYLRVTPWLPPGKFLGFLDAMDVYLDCPAFSGYTTAWQAVHRGLPIVTLEGEFLRQRLASGVLRQVGLLDGIASSRDDYVRLAVEFARDVFEPGRASMRRHSLREASSRADGNVASVTGLQQVLSGESRLRPDPGATGP
jgi:predicted O-linked N-acetylglucosamine transferase (SPINDLY family)